MVMSLPQRWRCRFEACWRAQLTRTMKKAERIAIIQEEVAMLDGMINEVKGQLDQVQSNLTKLTLVKKTLEESLGGQKDFLDKLN